MRLIAFALCLALAFFALPANAAGPCGDVKFVLDVAKGETDAVRHDTLLLYGLRYAKDADDRAALGAAATREATKARVKYWPEVPERCTLCNGTGHSALGKPCPGCHGAGWTGPMKSKVALPKVMLPRCDLCNGTGEMIPGQPCPGCHGSGYPGPMKSAKRDAGTAKVWPAVSERCTLCDGTGKDALGRLCPGCHGAGMTGPMRIVQDNPFFCDMCHGTGQLFPGKTCPMCHGSGMNGPMRQATRPAIFDRFLEQSLKARAVAGGDAKAKELLDEVLRLREENR